MTIETSETLVAGLLVLAGIVGVIVPVLPGLVLVLAGIALWAVPRGDTLGWTVLGAAILIVVIGSVAKYLVPGRRLRDSGVPNRTIAAGGVFGVIGFFVVPVLGLFLGFVYGAVVGMFLIATKLRSRKDHVPFGPFLAAGAMTAVLVGDVIVDWYRG